MSSEFPRVRKTSVDPTRSEHVRFERASGSDAYYCVMHANLASMVLTPDETKAISTTHHDLLNEPDESVLTKKDICLVMRGRHYEDVCIWERCIQQSRFLVVQ